MARTKRATHVLKYKEGDQEVGGYDVVAAPGLFVHKMWIEGREEAKPVRWHVSHVESGLNIMGHWVSGFDKKNDALDAAEQAAPLANWLLPKDQLLEEYINLKEDLREQELARADARNRNES